MDYPVVVGYNGTKPADEAVLWAANEAVQRGLPLVVLYAANFPGMTLPPGGGQLESETGALDAAKEMTTRGVAEARTAQPDLEVRGESTASSPTRALVEASSRASVVVVGSRGRGTVAGAFLGSVSFTVAAGAVCPVVIVKRDTSTRTVGPEHRVVVGTDGSLPAASAVKFAADVAADRSADLHLICGTGDPATLTFDQEQLRTSAEQILRDARADACRSYPQLTPVTQVTDGTPEQALTDASADAGLLVVGSRGRGAFQGMVAGSVSSAVIQRAQCPVVVLRGTEALDDVINVATRHDHTETPPTVSSYREGTANVPVQAQRLPGVGWRYAVPADRGKQLLILVEDTGDRHLAFADTLFDDPLATVRLNAASSSVVAALIAGARFHVEPPEDQAAEAREQDGTGGDR